MIDQFNSSAREDGNGFETISSKHYNFDVMHNITL